MSRKRQVFFNFPLGNKRGILFTIATILLVIPLFLFSYNSLQNTNQIYLSPGSRLRYIESDIALDYFELIGIDFDFNGEIMNFSVNISEDVDYDVLLSNYQNFIETTYSNKINTEINLIDLTSNLRSSFCDVNYNISNTEMFITLGDCGLDELHFVIDINKDHTDVIETDNPSSDGESYPKAYITVNSQNDHQIMNQQKYLDLSEENDPFYIGFGESQGRGKGKGQAVLDAFVSISIGENRGIDNSIYVTWSNTDVTFNDLYLVFEMTNQTMALETDARISISSNMDDISKNSNLILQE